MRAYLVRNDKRRRDLFQKYEKIRCLYKFLQQNSKLTNSQRLHYSRALTFLPKNSSITRIKNRCLITGRGRSVYRDFQLTRMQLRELASFGMLMGIKKSSW